MYITYYKAKGMRLCKFSTINCNKFKKKMIHFKRTICHMCTSCKKSFFKRTKIFKKSKSRLSPKLTKSTELMEIKPIKQSKFIGKNLPKKSLENPRLTERIKESQLKEQLKEAQIKESQLKAQLKEAHNRESQFNEKLKEFRLNEKIRDAKFKEALREAIKEKISELVDKPLKKTLNNYEIKDTIPFHPNNLGVSSVSVLKVPVVSSKHPVLRPETLGVPVVSLKHPATVAPVLRPETLGVPVVSLKHPATVAPVLRPETLGVPVVSLKHPATETISNSDTDDDFSSINETSKNLRDVVIDIVNNTSETDDDWDNISNISYDDYLNVVNENAKNNEKC